MATDAALQYMIQCSHIPEEELFQICIDFWSFFTLDILKKTKSGIWDSTAVGKVEAIQEQMLNGNTAVGVNVQNSYLHANVYPNILQQLRATLIENMARPREVLVMTDDNGDIVQEQVDDTQKNFLYE